jgi:hypothetical protein
MMFFRRPLLLLSIVLILAGVGFGAWVSTRSNDQASNSTNESNTAGKKYSEAYDAAFRSSSTETRILVDAVHFSSTLTSALKALPQKSDQQDEISRKLAEFNADERRLAFVVSYSVPSGPLPDDTIVEGSTLADEQGRSYPLFVSQRIYSGMTPPAQVSPLIQHSYLLIFNTPAESVTPQRLTLIVPAGDTTPRTFTWE